MSKKIKLLYFVAEDWYFWSHRRLLAQSAKKNGYEVFVLTRVNIHGDKIEAMGFKLIPINMERHGKNIFRELILLAKIIACYKKIRPDLAHHIAMKPVLYGKIAALLSGVKKSVNTFPGLGYVFLSKNMIDRVLGFFIKNILKYLLRLNDNKIIVQNEDDARFFVEERICKENDLFLIRGSGIDLNEFKNNNSQESQPIILFASRLLIQKGIADFVEAAKIAKQINRNLRFVIVGKPDQSNPNSITITQLQKWQENDHIEWWGYRENISEILNQAKMIVLPTFYGEGIPKILIEAAASGKPIIATNVAGCREIVKNNVNGYLVPVHDPGNIANHIIKLVHNDELCNRMGMEGRRMVENGFSIKKVNEETLAVYKMLLDAEG